VYINRYGPPATGQNDFPYAALARMNIATREQMTSKTRKAKTTMVTTLLGLGFAV
jgi:hypothetical protein